MPLYARHLLLLHLPSGTLLSLGQAAWAASAWLRVKDCIAFLKASRVQSMNEQDPSVSGSALTSPSLGNPQVMAEVMGAEAALVRCQLVSGTHAIATALFACLRPGDRLLAVAGRCEASCQAHPVARQL